MHWLRTANPHNLLFPDYKAQFKLCQIIGNRILMHLKQYPHVDMKGVIYEVDAKSRGISGLGGE